MISLPRALPYPPSLLKPSQPVVMVDSESVSVVENDSDIDMDIESERLAPPPQEIKLRPSILAD